MSSSSSLCLNLGMKIFLRQSVDCKQYPMFCDKKLNCAEEPRTDMM